MPTARAGYFLKDGTKVPSVTTVLSRFKESGGLIHWSWKLGTEGKDYRRARDDAASSGTLAHDMIERFLTGKPPLPYDPKVAEEVRHDADVAFGAFTDWYSATGIKATSAEEALVSEVYGFGGTPDFLYDPHGLGDFKTSKKIYPEAWLQLGGYKVLLEANGRGPIKTGLIARFDKESGKWNEQHISQKDLLAAEKTFLSMLKTYKLVKDIERRAAKP